MKSCRNLSFCCEDFSSIFNPSQLKNIFYAHWQKVKVLFSTDFFFLYLTWSITSSMSFFDKALRKLQKV